MGLLQGMFEKKFQRELQAKGVKFTREADDGRESDPG
jgi:hypothetical protein